MWSFLCNAIALELAPSDKVVDSKDSICYCDDAFF